MASRVVLDALGDLAYQFVVIELDQRIFQSRSITIVALRDVLLRLSHR